MMATMCTTLIYPTKQLDILEQCIQARLNVFVEEYFYFLKKDVPPGMISKLLMVLPIEHSRLHA